MPCDRITVKAHQDVQFGCICTAHSLDEAPATENRQRPITPRSQASERVICFSIRCLCVKRHLQLRTDFRVSQTDSAGSVDEQEVLHLLQSCDMCGGVRELSGRNLALKKIILHELVSERQHDGSDSLPVRRRYDSSSRAT